MMNTLLLVRRITIKFRFSAKADYCGNSQLLPLCAQSGFLLQHVLFTIPIGIENDDSQGQLWLHYPENGEHFVTLVVTISSPETIWILADRRLTFNKGRPPRDDAQKVMFLETTDGVAILGYAGLGVTARGTEPSEWMSNVLRGRKLPLEQSLGVLAEAMNKQLPQHLKLLSIYGGLPHILVATAFLGNEQRLYTIDLIPSPDRTSYNFRYMRHVSEKTKSTKPRIPPLGIGGSGAAYLTQHKTWMRSVLRLARAHDRGQVSSQVVADYLAKLNYEVHLGTSDKTVGPTCIVGWRYSKEGVHKGGGGHYFYTGTTKDASSPSLPTIANGMDVCAIANMLMPNIFERSRAILDGQSTKDITLNEINSELARLPDKPDENLR